LDTHALLWWLSDDPALPSAARKCIRARSNAILVSPASAWEIATKFRIGKLPLGSDLAVHFETYLAQESSNPCRPLLPTPPAPAFFPVLIAILSIAG